MQDGNKQAVEERVVADHDKTKDPVAPVAGDIAPKAEPVSAPATSPSVHKVNPIFAPAKTATK